MPINPEKRKEKSCGKKEKNKEPLFDANNCISTLEPPWQEVMRVWLEYKHSRKERYKSEMSVGKCLSQLKSLSGSNTQTAQQIIDQSIANNWAGLFPLRNQGYQARGQPATGQHIGQIKQPESEEKKNRIIKNFGKN